MTEPKLMKVSDYAKQQGVTPKTVWAWVRKGIIQVRRLGPRTGVRIIVEPHHRD